MDVIFIVQRVSNNGSVGVVMFKDLVSSNNDFNTIVSNYLKDYYLALGMYDLANLRLDFLKNFNLMYKISENKEGDAELYKNIDSYFNFLNKNLSVYTKNEYEKLSRIIRGASIIMKNGIELDSFYHFYRGYISLREDINRFRLSKEIYKERILK